MAGAGAAGLAPKAKRPARTKTEGQASALAPAPCRKARHASNLPCRVKSLLASAEQKTKAQREGIGGVSIDRACACPHAALLRVTHIWAETA